MAEPPQGSEPGSNPQLSPAKVDRPSAPPAVGPSAKELAPQHGGLRSGRPRLDGIIPGTKEALEADRKKDRERKAQKRHPDPAALPSRGNGRPVRPVAAPGPAPAAPVPVVSPLAPGEPLPIAAKTLEPLAAQLIQAGEALAVRSLVDRAEKGKLPAALCKEIERDAHWNELTRESLKASAPEVAAQICNYFGIENAPVLVLCTSLGSLAVSHVLLMRRIDKAIEELKAAQAAAANNSEAAKRV